MLQLHFPGDGQGGGYFCLVMASFGMIASFRSTHRNVSMNNIVCVNHNELAGMLCFMTLANVCYSISYPSQLAASLVVREMTAWKSGGSCRDSYSFNPFPKGYFFSSTDTKGIFTGQLPCSSSSSMAQASY